MSWVKTDNADLAAKVEQRVRYLERYHPEGPIEILETCQGSGLIWGRVKVELPHRQLRVTGIDVKPKAGRLRLKSERFLAMPGWSFDVIDVDTYGSPWTHWFHALENAPTDRPLTVFLTYGDVMAAGAGGFNPRHLTMLGLDLGEHRLPPGLGSRVYQRCTNMLIGLAHRYGWKPENVESIRPTPRVTYYALHLRRL